MRKQLVATVENLLEKDHRITLLLCDIGVYGFRRAFELYPERVYNIGILEQSTVSLAAGMSKTGLIPVVHTIAPFLIERSFEQLKVDFCYQNIGGNFISVGASYDYAALGCTHHCPGDVGVLKNLPGMEILVPGNAAEFDLLFRQTYSNNHPTYFRLSERENPIGYDVKFGKAEVIQRGKSATIVAIGPILGTVLEAAKNHDVTVLYYSTVIPFDNETLRENIPSSKVLLCEPYYSGGLAAEICNALWPKPIILDFIGVSHRFLTNYGNAKEHDESIGFTPRDISIRIKRLIHA